MDDIRRLEEVAANTNPAFETMIYDGWLLRFTGFVDAARMA